MQAAEHKRYDRHILMPEIGEAGQERFLKASVLVIGAGGLGCPVLQYLAAAGVGRIGIVDKDVVEESNLQRQILFSTEDIGKPKAECAMRQLKKLNPFIQADAFILELNENNALDLIRKYEIVIDGSDNFRTRYLVSDACVILQKTLISGSVYKFEGQLSVFNYKEGPTYRCLYPEPGELGGCSETGILGVLPGTIGCMMATEALKIISELGDVLSGKLLVYDALRATQKIFSFVAVPANKQIKSILPFTDTCTTKSELKEIDADSFLELRASQDVFVLDVREPGEYEEINIGAVLIPLGQLAHRFSEIPKNKIVIVHCKGGSRSKKAQVFLTDKGFKEVLNLKGGIKTVLEARQQKA
jgi:molybdopterin/thiamine biosynthesis adenylyltransferase/rhodanese-related sulfurtransferase